VTTSAVNNVRIVCDNIRHNAQWWEDGEGNIVVRHRTLGERRAKLDCLPPPAHAEGLLREMLQVGLARPSRSCN
jgi:hypothetical protein